eukprot:2872327-Amphidinium_carterae.1
MPPQEIERIVSEKSGHKLLSLSTGPIPGSLEAPAVLLSDNLLEGAIPEHLLDGRDPLEKWVAARTSVSTRFSSTYGVCIQNPKSIPVAACDYSVCLVRPFTTSICKVVQRSSPQECDHGWK